MDSLSFSEFASRSITIILFGYVGFKLSDRFSGPKSVISWIVLVIASLLAWAIGVGVRIISIFGASLYLNSLLGGVGLGLLLGFIVRSMKMRTDATKATLQP